MRWHVEAQFENREQASQAAAMMRTIMPVYMHLSAEDNEREAWSEYFRGYDAHAARLRDDGR